MLEVFPALRMEFRSHALVIHEDDVPLARNVANLGDVDTRDSGRDLLATRPREKQFVVVTAMQGKLQIDFVNWLPDAGAGDARSLDLRANTTLFADMPEVGGEAVAEIDHGRGKTFFQQKLANLDSRHGMEVPGEISVPKSLAGE
jgi:hypothetical protein